jgi:hypothetical protein
LRSSRQAADLSAPLTEDSGPVSYLAGDFVVESDRAQLGEIVQRERAGRRRTNIGNVAT